MQISSLAPEKTATSRTRSLISRLNIPKSTGLMKTAATAQDTAVTEHEEELNQSEHEIFDETGLLSLSLFLSFP